MNHPYIVYTIKYLIIRHLGEGNKKNTTQDTFLSIVL